MCRASSTAMRSDADMLDVGWPEPAEVLARMASTRSCWASSWMALKSSEFTSVVTTNSYRTRRSHADREPVCDERADGEPLPGAGRCRRWCRRGVGAVEHNAALALLLGAVHGGVGIS